MPSATVHNFQGNSTLVQGHCLDVLQTLPAASVDCCVTSPPYWGLRDYHTAEQVWDGRAGCMHKWEAPRTQRMGTFCFRCGAWRGSLGLEPTPELYVAHLVAIFREVHRVLKSTGTLWLVLGDCYAGSWGSYRRTGAVGTSLARPSQVDGCFVPPTAAGHGLKRKDLIGIPWMVAFALRSDGWFLRSNIVWHKPNAMPESIKDRPTCAHEFVFLLAKSSRYYYDTDAIREPIKAASRARWGSKATPNRVLDQGHPLGRKHSLRPEQLLHPLGRNRRTVWSIATSPFRGPHFATFPKELVRPCVRAGAPAGGFVLDPFAGTGTVGIVCKEEDRRFVGIELSEKYLDLARSRIPS